MKRVTRTTATAHIPKRNFRYINDNLVDIFNTIKSFLKEYEDKLDVKADNEFYYELWTNRGFRFKSFRPRSQKGIAFAAIIAFENYIGFYFPPLSAHPVLKDSLKPELKIFSKGLYTFHFDVLEPAAASQLQEMIQNGWALFKKDRLV